MAQWLAPSTFRVGRTVRTVFPGAGRMTTRREGRGMVSSGNDGDSLGALAHWLHHVGEAGRLRALREARGTP